MSDQQPESDTRDDVTGLREDTQGLTHAVEVFATKAQVNDARRLAKRANINSSLAAVALVLVAVVAFIGWHSNSSTLDSFEHDRVDRSYGSCVQFDINQQNTRNAIINGLVDTFRPLIQPGQEARLAEFARSLRVNVDAQLPFRDCSPAGIEAFLKNPPKDPAGG